MLGAGATYAVTALNERAKWRRMQNTRWDDRRLAAYSEYGNALKKLVTVSYQLAAARGYPAATQPIDLDIGLRVLAETEVERSIKWETMLLLASPEAIAAARDWHTAAWALGHVAQGRAVDHEVYTRLYENMGRRRNEFYKCARIDLGVGSGVLPAEHEAWLIGWAQSVPTPENP